MRKISRRTVLAGTGSAVLAASGGWTGARAQAFPSQNFNIVCAFPAGSGSDVIVRYFAEKLRPLAKRTVIVDNCHQHAFLVRPCANSG